MAKKGSISKSAPAPDHAQSDPGPATPRPRRRSLPAASKAKAPEPEFRVTYKDGVFLLTGQDEVVRLHYEACTQIDAKRGYLLYYSPSAEQRHEECLRDYLYQASGQDWELVDARLLHRRWSELSGGERDRLARREGFELVKGLPFLID